jgi:photosystem II stability/assembly factor-like uncharacterized protein
MSRYPLRPVVVLCTIAALGIAPAGPDRAPVESPHWTTNGPATGGFIRIEIDAARPATLYALTSYHWLLRSDDGGDRWRSINLSESPVSLFRGFGAAPGASGVLYAFIGNDLYRSRDSGDSWSPAGDVPGPGGLHGIVVDPMRPETIYASTLEPSRLVQRGRLYKSVDAGQTWASLPLLGSSLGRILIDPGNPSLIYAAPGQGFPIVRSVDGGENWNSILPAGQLGAFDVAADPLDFNTIYVTTLTTSQTGSLFVSHDRGDTWSAMNPPPGGVPIEVAVDRSTPQRVYVGLQSGLYRTEDGGRTWTLLHFGLTGVVIDPSDPRVLYAFGSKSVDGGLSWTTLPTGDVASGVNALTLDPGSPGTVYAAGNDSAPGIFRTSDGGRSWTPLRTGLPALSVSPSSVVVDPSDPNVLYAGFAGSASVPGVFKSETHGVVWYPSGAGLPENGVLQLFIDARQPRTLYALTLAQGVYRSDDGGASWRGINDGLTSAPAQLALDPSDSTRLYAAAGDRIFRTFDRGETWSGSPVVVLNSPDPSLNQLGPLVVDPLRPWILFSAGTLGLGVLRSTDMGQTWTIVAAPVPPDAVPTAVAIDPSQPLEVYAGTRFGRILHSSNGGDTWRALDRGLPFAQITPSSSTA